MGGQVTVEGDESDGTRIVTVRQQSEGAELVLLLFASETTVAQAAIVAANGESVDPAVTSHIRDRLVERIG